MSTRALLFMILAVLGIMIYMEWQRDYSAPSAEDPAAESAGAEVASEPESAESQPPDDLPDLPDLTEEQSPDEEESDVPEAAGADVRAARRVEVSTDVLDVEIDPIGGSIVDLRLKDYPVSLDRPDEPFVLMEQALPEWFVAQAGLLRDGGDAPNHTTEYQVDSDYFELAPDAERVEVPMTWRGDDGVEIVATWVFHRGDYVVDLNIEVRNESGSEWRGSRYVQLQRTSPDRSNGMLLTNPERISYVGAGVYDPEERFRKIPFDDFSEQRFSDTFAEGWAGMIQHYFMAAWVPPADQRHRYTTRHVQTDRLPRHVLAATSPVVTVQPGGNYQFEARLFAGPKLQNRLDEVAPGLGLTVDYGIFTILSRPLFWLLDKIHMVVANWGLAIILLTLLIKLAFYKLTQAQFRSMGKLRKLQPRIQQLKERYGDDRQKFGQAMMEIYKKEKVNPLGGCLPILVQIPIFISLYWVLLESVELRQAGFLWVPDLSQPDPYFILPVINGAFMILTQRLMPTGGMDPTQRKLMQWLPVVFAVLFAFFPAGLVLYWAANSGISLLQQWYILRQIDAEEARKARA